MPIPIIERASRFAARRAIASSGRDFSYGDLLSTSEGVAAGILGSRSDLDGERVALLTRPSFAWSAAQWGIWRAGGIVVPLCVSHPRPELQLVLRDSGATIAVTDSHCDATMRPIAESMGLRLERAEDLMGHAPRSLPEVDAARSAMIVYTSGTTGSGKGVLTTHSNLRAQITSLVQAWRWEPDDRILLTLPLHHVHGIVNVLGCALWSGAMCEMLPQFDADVVWSRIADGDLTLFMAVPTIYRRLLTSWEESSESERERRTDGARRLRLMVSGSAALPEGLFHRWKEITGHELLERYGMTEIGMALSNPLDGERRPGFVGSPLPGVEVRRVDERGQPVTDSDPGEIEIKGETVFREYWQRPQETAQAFHDGWFRTGDIAVVDQGSFRLLGRASVDIIKTGGYKVSALEIESVLQDHPAIAECAVVGVEDPEWGERVAAGVVLLPTKDLDLRSLRAWGRERLAPYKLPQQLEIFEALPRNALGKVLKPELRRRMLSAD